MSKPTMTKEELDRYTALLNSQGVLSLGNIASVTGTTAAQPPLPVHPPGWGSGVPAKPASVEDMTRAILDANRQRAAEPVTSFEPDELTRKGLLGAARPPLPTYGDLLGAAARAYTRPGVAHKVLDADLCAAVAHEMAALLGLPVAEKPATLPPRKKLLIARFPGSGTECSANVDWLIDTAFGFGTKRFPVYEQFEFLRPIRFTDTPIDMVRNLAVEAAQKLGADYLVMVDQDMGVDYLLRHDDPRAKPFLPEALAFALKYGKPCVCGVPYVGPPPHENVYAFKWAVAETGGGGFMPRLDQFGREEAAVRRGVEQVAALATGCVLIDMRVFDQLPVPHFYYEYDDATRRRKASTEDVTFSRDLALLRIPQFIFWDCWSTHLKTKACPRPEILPADFVADQLIARAGKGRKVDEVVVDMAPEKVWWPGWLDGVDRRDRLPVNDGSVVAHSKAYNPGRVAEGEPLVQLTKVG